MSVANGASAPEFKVTIKGDGVDVAKQVDAETAKEIIALLMGGGSPASTATAGARRKRTASARQSKRSSSGAPKVKRKAGLPGVVKDLSMRPKGKKSYADFVSEKQPKTHQQKQAAILYWLREYGGVSEGITLDHVNTCYIEAHWPRPANLENAISVTAKQKGWIDSSDKTNIRLTTRGEDEVVHGLPPTPKQKK
ncbi:MAG TPA: hypothetical protein VHY83_01945 [Solirubrobacteraceae bacterium]|jgi:hypothetical protein|nr:hypothetical protein [Solirubrobacteraceae bacterium]